MTSSASRPASEVEPGAATSVAPKAPDAVVPAMRRLLARLGAPGLIAAFVGVTLAGSVAEAGVLVVLASGAAALAGGEGFAEVGVGPLHLSMTITRAASIGLGLSLLMVSARLAVAHLVSTLSRRWLHTTRSDLVRALVSAPWYVQAATPYSRFQDLVSVQALRMANLVAVLGNLVVGVVAFLAMVATALAVSPITAGLLAVVGVLLSLLFRPVARRLQSLSSAHLMAHHEYSAELADVYGVLAETRIYGVRGEVTARHDTRSRAVAQTYGQMRLWGLIQPALYTGIVMVVLVSGLYAARSVESLDTALIGAIVLVMLRGLRYSQQAQTTWHHAVELLPYVTDAEDAVSALGGDGHLWGTASLEPVDTLELRGVTYRYPSGDVGVEDVDLTIRAGDVVGLVGPSGAGKSTLAQLVLGLRHPKDGEVLANGRSRSEYREDAWYERFAYVPQQPVLLAGDVRHNVRFLRSSVTDEDVDQALADAAMGPDLATWARGAQRDVGVHGGEVSGGQRQRIAIARALAGHPDVLVLDEPTSALDADAETVITDTIERLRGRVTIVLVAHRASTLSVCDVRVQMLDGRVTTVVRADVDAEHGD